MLCSKVSLFFDWEIVQEQPFETTRCVIVAGKHTSNWDYVLMLRAVWALGIRPYVMIKKEAFFPPLGYLLKALRGIPVDRKNPKAVFRLIEHLMANTGDFVLVITPEGTRSGVKTLKSGFVRIAAATDVPIVPATVHADKRQVHIHRPISAHPECDAVNLVESLFATSTGLSPFTAEQIRVRRNQRDNP